MTATESQRTNQGLVLRSPWTLLLGAGETAQQFRMPAAMAEDPHSVPSTRLVAHTYPQRQCQGVICSLLASVGMACIHRYSELKPLYTYT